MRSILKFLLASTLLASASLAYCGPGPGIEIDSMPLSISRGEFLKARPGAREFGLRNEPYDYIYLAPPKTMAFGRPVGMFGRGFVGDSGCAASIGFSPSSTEEAKVLVARVSALFPVKKKERRFKSAEGSIIYLESKDAFASLIQTPAATGAEINVVHAVSLKSCSTNVNRGRWQTRP